jgi:hypothetical protein
VKTEGYATKWWSSNRVLELEISSRLAFVWCFSYLCKIWESSKSDAGYQPRVTNDCGAPRSIQMKNSSHFSF